MTRILRSKRTRVVVGVVVLLVMVGVGLHDSNTKKEKELIAIAEELLAKQYREAVESITFSSVEITEVQPNSIIVEGFAHWVCPSSTYATHQQYEMIVHLSKIENEWTITRVHNDSYESVWHRIMEEIGQLIP